MSPNCCVLVYPSTPSSSVVAQDGNPKTPSLQNFGQRQA